MTLASRTLIGQCPLKSDHWFNTGTNNYGSSIYLSFWFIGTMLGYNEFCFHWPLDSSYPPGHISLTRNKFWFDQMISFFSHFYLHSYLRRKSLQSSKLYVKLYSCYLAVFSNIRHWIWMTVPSSVFPIRRGWITWSLKSRLYDSPK